MNIEGVHIFNLGSVSNPMPPDLRASYAILETDAAGYHLESRFVEYDHQAVIAAVHAVKHPAAHSSSITNWAKTYRAGKLHNQRASFPFFFTGIDHRQTGKDQTHTPIIPQVIFSARNAITMIHATIGGR